MTAVAWQALTLPGIELRAWQLRDHCDAAACALADRHYSRRRPRSGQIGPPGRKLVMVTPCERAVWLTHWPFAEIALDGLDAWRCTIFRNEGAGLSSELIREAMALTEECWGTRPRDGWITWIDPRKIASTNPGFCFLAAGWHRDTAWKHRHLIRLRAFDAGRRAAACPVGAPAPEPTARADGQLSLIEMHAEA